MRESIPPSQQTAYVARIFNEMEEEYDHLSDLWYRYTFGEIDRVLRSHCAPTATSPKPVAIDVGCGTGIQSLALASLGYRLEGIDIAERLLARAEAKLEAAGHADARFQVADAVALPFEDGTADVINCCGPTLSFIPDWRQALAEMARCLRPGGRLLLEVEGKWNLDLFWELASSLLGDVLGYDTTLRKALGNFAFPWTRGHDIDYPFTLESGERVTMPLRLFTARELRRELAGVALTQRRRWGLHALTNLIPSTVLHETDPGPITRGAFAILSRTERVFHGHLPLNALGCSLLVLAEKEEA